MGETPPAPALRLTSEPARTRQSKRARVPCRRVRVWAVAVTLTVCGCLRSALFLMLSLLLLTNVPGPALDMWCGDLGNCCHKNDKESRERYLSSVRRDTVLIKTVPRPATDIPHPRHPQKRSTVECRLQVNDSNRGQRTAIAARRGKMRLARSRRRPVARVASACLVLSCVTLYLFPVNSGPDPAPPHAHPRRPSRRVFYPV